MYVVTSIFQGCFTLCVAYTMGVQLYSADLLETAKPVKRRLKKVKAEVADPVEPVDVAPASPPPTAESVSEQSVEEVKVKKEKKPRSEKQIAALERAKEARRLKKEQAEKEKQEALEQERLQQEEEERKAAEKLAKKEAAKEKRRLARLAKKEATDVNVEDAAEPPVKKRKTRETGEPPEWFKKYIHGVKTEQSKSSSEKKSQRILKEEVSEEAKQRWDDSQTRDRVTHEVDNHMNRMYSMIFGQRRMVQ